MISPYLSKMEVLFKDTMLQTRSRNIEPLSEIFGPFKMGVYQSMYVIS